MKKGKHSQKTRNKIGNGYKSQEKVRMAGNPGKKSRTTRNLMRNARSARNPKKKKKKKKGRNDQGNQIKGKSVQ